MDAAWTENLWFWKSSEEAIEIECIAVKFSVDERQQKCITAQEAQEYVECAEANGVICEANLSCQTSKVIPDCINQQIIQESNTLKRINQLHEYEWDHWLEIHFGEEASWVFRNDATTSVIPVE